MQADSSTIRDDVTLGRPAGEHGPRNVPSMVSGGAREMIIGGHRRPAVSGRRLDSIDPTTESVIAQVPRGDHDDVDAAVSDARRAFEDASWSGIDPDERGRIISQVADVVAANADEIATIDSYDMGAPIFLTRWMLQDVVKVFRHYAGYPTKVYGQTAPTRAGRFGYTLRQPLGVVGAIWGWNGPMLQLSYKVAAALATGNTVVAKPPEWASLSTLRFAELLEQTDLPPGVVNVVTGTGPEAGDALVRHLGVNKIAFTGSTATGRHIHEAVSPDLKRLTLELGGKSPLIVLADADLDAAAATAAAGFLMGSGQGCVCSTRIFVQSGIRQQFTDRLVAAMAAYPPGNPLDADTRLGPLAARPHFERVMSYLALAREEGTRVLVGGDRLGERGLFVAPTLLGDARNDMRVAREEIFGPVAVLMSFDTVDEAIALGNDTPYGLAASVWTSNLSAAHHFAERLQVGTVWINTFGEMSTGTLPFGGYKQSGIGREHGTEVIDAYTQSKAVLVAL